MAAGYWLALPATALLLLGAGLSLRDALRSPDPDRRAQLSFLCTLAYALVAGRLGVPADIANLAVWLASDESAFATGQCYTLDGGLTAASPLNPGLF